MCENHKGQQLVETLVPEGSPAAFRGPEGPYYLDIPDREPESLSDSGLSDVKLRDNIANFLYNSGRFEKADQIMSCGTKWMRKACSNGHTKLSRKTCSIPYCPVCSKKGSWLNKRRAKRLRSALLGYSGGLGHIVLTLPKDLSASLPDSAQLGKLYKKAWELMKDWLDAPAAVVVLHFCGDESKGLHLHFDCTFPILEPGANFFAAGILEKVRQHWTMAVNTIFRVGFKYENAVIYYNYAEEQEKQLHLIKYVTRSTIAADKFVDLTNEEKEYIVTLSSKNNIRYYGELAGKKKPVFQAKHQNKKAFDMILQDPTEALDYDICPICNEKMKVVKDEKGRPKFDFLDDINLRNFVRYNAYTFIDREIDAHLRARDAAKQVAEQKKAEFDALPLADRLAFAEMEKNISRILDLSPEEVFIDEV